MFPFKKKIDCLTFTEEELNLLSASFCACIYNIPVLRAKLGIEQLHKFTLEFEIPSSTGGFISYTSVELKKIRENEK